MPSRKILVIFIICFGMVVSIWILRSGTKTVLVSTPKPEEIVVSGNSPTATNTDWQKILGTIQSDTTVAEGIGQNSGTSTEDATVTYQLAKDFFGRYLLTQSQMNQNGMDTSQGFDTDVSDQIVSDVLSSPAYTTIRSVVYTTKNLNVQPNSDQTVVQNYLNSLATNAAQMQNSNKNLDEIDIINSAILNQDQKEITKLDPIIQSYKTLISNMLKTPVPNNAAGLHLEFVNSISRVLYDLEAIRDTFIDPVKSLAAISAYKNDYISMGMSIQALGAYAQMKSNTSAK